MFLFHNKKGIILSIDIYIFQDGWKHQPDYGKLLILNHLEKIILLLWWLVNHLKKPMDILIVVLVSPPIFHGDLSDLQSLSSATIGKWF